MEENKNKQEEIMNESNCNAKEMDDNQTTDDETTIGKLFERVITDQAFKKLLIENPDEALSEYELTDTQAVLIKSLSDEDLDKLTADNLDEFFAADAAVYTPDEADLMDFEEYDPEDFEEIDSE